MPVAEAGGVSGAPVPTEAGVRRCAGCGRDNHPTRELCRTCGTDLTSGRPLDPVAQRVGALRAADLVLPHRALRERLLTGTLVVLLAVAVVLGPMALFELGPFAPTERLDRATFLIAAYPEDPVVVEVDSVETTTSVSSAPDRTFSPLHLFDGDTGSAWVGEPADTEGAGEIIRLELVEPAWVSRIELRNGDHLSSEAYERSERLQRVVIAFDGGRDYRVDLLDIGLQAQVVELPSPELTTTVTVRVERVFPGTDLRGAALSEITIVGWLADSADRALARQRAQWS